MGSVPSGTVSGWSGVTRYSPREIERALDRFRDDDPGDYSGIIFIGPDDTDENGDIIPEKLAAKRPDGMENAEELHAPGAANEVRIDLSNIDTDDPPWRGPADDDEANQ